MTPLAITLVVLIPFAALRLTRLATTDKIAEHLVIGRLRKRAAMKPGSQGEMVPVNLAGYLVELLDCPFCAGFWLTVIVLVPGVLVALFAPPVVVLLFVLVYGALGLSYIVGHVSHRIDK